MHTGMPDRSIVENRFAKFELVVLDATRLSEEIVQL